MKQVPAENGYENNINKKSEGDYSVEKTLFKHMYCSNYSEAGETCVVKRT